MQTNPKKTENATQFCDTLYNSGRLRMLITGVMITLGYIGIYWPLDAAVAQTKRRLATEENRRALIQDIEQLRGEVQNFRDRVPDHSDTNEWVQYVLAGAREFPLKVTALDPAEQQRVGPYKVIVLHLELEGTFHDLDAFINWLESNDRLFRVDSVKLSPARIGSALQLQLTVLGLTG